MEHAHDDLEQYSYRLNVPVGDIPVATDETADNVLEKVKNILKETYLNLSGNIIDWAHHIRSNYQCFKTSNNCRSAIVRFNSFKHKTFFYQN